MQVVPVYSEAPSQDILLRAYDKCPTLRDSLAAHHASASFAAQETASLPLRETVAAAMGSEVPPLRDFYNTFDVLHLRQLGEPLDTDVPLLDAPTWLQVGALPLSLSLSLCLTLSLCLSLSLSLSLGEPPLSLPRAGGAAGVACGAGAVQPRGGAQLVWRHAAVPPGDPPAPHGGTAWSRAAAVQCSLPHAAVPAVRAALQPLGRRACTRPARALPSTLLSKPTVLGSFPLARGSAWAGGRDHTPSRVPHRWSTTSCREAAPFTYSPGFQQRSNRDNADVKPT